MVGTKLGDTGKGQRSVAGWTRWVNAGHLHIYISALSFFAFYAVLYLCKELHTLADPVLCWRKMLPSTIWHRPVHFAAHVPLQLLASFVPCSFNLPQGGISLSAGSADWVLTDSYSYCMQCCVLEQHGCTSTPLGCIEAVTGMIGPV